MTIRLTVGGTLNFLGSIINSTSGSGKSFGKSSCNFVSTSLIISLAVFGLSLSVFCKALIISKSLIRFLESIFVLEFIVNSPDYTKFFMPSLNSIIIYAFKNLYNGRINPFLLKIFNSFIKVTFNCNFITLHLCNKILIFTFGKEFNNFFTILRNIYAIAESDGSLIIFEANRFF